MVKGLSIATLRETAYLGLAITVTACASAADNASTDRFGDLSGTRWRLVEFESSDDAIGVQRPDDPDSYILELHPDGTAAMQLNCNRASGSWTAEPTDGESGTFTFGTMAVTQALCAPPSMDEDIARHVEFIRGYVVRDGRLYLSLMADGGIYAWERIPSTQ